MAFAPPKKHQKENQFENKSFGINVNPVDECTDFDVSKGLSNQLSFLEKNAKRIKNQQDALMPLVNINELLPTLQRADSSIKSFENRIAESNNAISHLEYQIKQFVVTNNLQDNLKRKTGEIDPKILQKLKKMDEIEKYLSELHLKISNFPKLQEVKYKEEKVNMIREIESKKNPSQEQFLETKSFQEELSKVLAESCEEYEQEISAEIVNIKNDVGLLRCRLYELNDDRWMKTLDKEMRKLPKFTNAIQMKIALQSVELEIKLGFLLLFRRNVGIFPEQK